VKADADTAAPAVPGGLAASNITSNAFTLTWAESTDDVGVTGYNVFLDGLLYASPTGASVNVTGRTAETTYSATVRAIDAAGNMSAQSAALEVTTTAAPPDEPGEGSIGINLTDTANALAAGDIVGVVPAANWNNSTANNEVMNDITDSHGIATTADFVFSNTPAFYKNSTAAHAPPLADDASMMRTQRGRSNVNNMSVTATQISYAGYDVYIYWGGRASSESVPLTMTIAFQLWDGAAWVTNETKYIRDTNRVWSGIYSESTAIAAADAVDGNDYVVFRNVTADRFKVLATAANRAGISGLQVVAHSESTEEPAPAPVITDVSPVGGTYGEFFQYAIAAGGNPASYGAIGLPAGLSLDSATGIVSGTPATTGVFNIELSATNASGTDTASLMLTIAPAAQAITFPNPGSKTFGDASFALAASASSNLPVAYAIASGPVELSSNIVTVIGAGPVTITATQSGDANFLPAAPVEISFDVAQRPQTITFLQPGPRTFGDAPVTLSATANTGLPVAYVLTSGPATLSGDVVTLTGSGTVTITATQSGDANTLPAEPVLISFEIVPAPAEVSLGSLWQLYDGQPKRITVATTPANLAVAVTYNGSSTPPTYPGSYDVEIIIDAPDYTGVASDTLVIAAGAVVRHAPTLNGSVRGSVQVLSAESTTLNSSASVSGDLLVPGTPSTRINGQPDFGGVIDGPGSAEHVGFVVTLNGPAALRHLVRHIDPVALPVVDTPPVPTSTRDATLNNASQSAGDFATLRNLTLNANAGTRTIPPGTYGSFIANGSSHLVLGIADSSEPAVYNLQGLTLNGNSSVKIVGPVILTLARGTNLNGEMGAGGAPELLLLRIATGGLTLNSGATLHGFVDAPDGTIIINGSATLTGGITSDRLVINSDAQLVTDEP
jgi:chitodextrinase